jgi:acyl-CoA thioester hydrolase
MTEFAFTETVDVRYQDHDTLGHVNNAIYVTYMEEARFAYLTEGVGIPPMELNMVVANLTVDFRRPVQFADEVEVGDSSWTMVYEVRDDEGVAVEGESVQVALEPGGRETRSVPEEWRAGFDEIEN